MIVLEDINGGMLAASQVESVAVKILQAISQQVDALSEKGLQPILLTSPPIRPALRKLTERSFPSLVLLSWNEIAPKVNVNSVAMVMM